MSIRLRLTAWYSGILAVMLLCFSAAIYGFVYLNTYEELKDRIQRQAELAHKQIYTINTYNGELNMGGSGPEESNLYMQIYIYDSEVYQLSRNLANTGLKFEAPDRASIVQGFHNVFIEGNHFLMYQKPIILRDYNNNPAAVLQVAAYVGEQDKLMERIMNVLLIGSSATLIAAFTFGLFLARKSMRPIEDVIQSANGIQTGNDLSSRIEYEGPPDEIGMLVQTVNNMLGRMEGVYKELEESYATQKRFVSDASHELRTPLTTIRGNIDLLQKIWEMEPGANPSLDDAAIRQMSLESVRDIADEAKRMSRLVADMLTLARSDTGRTFDKEPVALEPMMTEVARRASFLPRQAEWITGNMSALNGKYILGNKDYLQQMMFIFIDNAFKYTAEGEVSLDTVLYQSQIGIRISDTGIGMDKDEVPYIFDRFYRADESRGITEGIGLGLSIAKWIIDEHDGSVEVVTRKGEGTTFIIWLPILFAPPLE